MPNGFYIPDTNLDPSEREEKETPVQESWVKFEVRQIDGEKEVFLNGEPLKEIPEAVLKELLTELATDNL